jgi:hypothetical protein
VPLHSVRVATGRRRLGALLEVLRTSAQLFQPAAAMAGLPALCPRGDICAGSVRTATRRCPERARCTRYIQWGCGRHEVRVEVLTTHMHGELLVCTIEWVRRVASRCYARLAEATPRRQ